VSARYYKDLDLSGGVRIWVDFSTERGTIVNYRVVLLLDTLIGTETIRVYDGAHGYNEMHRYTRRFGKQTGTLFHSGSLAEGMRAAIQDMEARYLKMVEGGSDDEQQ
jgi:hypothetical protein